MGRDGRSGHSVLHSASERSGGPVREGRVGPPRAPPEGTGSAGTVAAPCLVLGCRLPSPFLPGHPAPAASGAARLCSRGPRPRARVTAAESLHAAPGCGRRSGLHVPGARDHALGEMGLWNPKGAGRREKRAESTEFLAASQPNSSDLAPGTFAGSASRRDRREPWGPRTFPSVSPQNPVHDSFFLRMISELSQLNLFALALPSRSARSSSKNRQVNRFRHSAMTATKRSAVRLNAKG